MSGYQAMNDYIIDKSDALATAHNRVRETSTAQYACYWPARRYWTVDIRKPMLHPGLNNVICVGGDHSETHA